NSTMLFVIARPPPSSTLFPYTTLFRSAVGFPVSKIERNPDVPGNCIQMYRRVGRAADRRIDPNSVEEGGPCQDVRRLAVGSDHRSEEHTSELQSRENLVCRLLLEKKNP